MLTDEQLAYRRGRVTASDARMLMNAADDAELLKLFNVKIGAEPPEPENYAMRVGSHMEPFIINEYEHISGILVTRRQEIVDHPQIKGFCCTLDGWHPKLNRVIEVKFASPFMSKDELFRYYYPQTAFQMACTDAADAVLVIGQGTTEPVEIECVRDGDYERELITRCLSFLQCIQSLTPPCALPIVIPPEKWRTVDLNVDTPNWGPELQAALVEYDETAEAAKAHDAWGKLARDVVPEDVGKVIAGNFTLSRNKKGVVTIRRAA
jgi:predicted phage-related endonuclease